MRDQLTEGAYYDKRKFEFEGVNYTKPAGLRGPTFTFGKEIDIAGTGFNPYDRTSIQRFVNRNRDKNPPILFQNARGHQYIVDYQSGSFVFIPKGNMAKATCIRLFSKDTDEPMNTSMETLERAMRVYMVVYDAMEKSGEVDKYGTLVIDVYNKKVRGYGSSINEDLSVLNGCAVKLDNDAEIWKEVESQMPAKGKGSESVRGTPVNKSLTPTAADLQVQGRELIMPGDGDCQARAFAAGKAKANGKNVTDPKVQAQIQEDAATYRSVALAELHRQLQGLQAKGAKARRAGSADIALNAEEVTVTRLLAATVHEDLIARKADLEKDALSYRADKNGPKALEADAAIRKVDDDIEKMQDVLDTRRDPAQANTLTRADLRVLTKHAVPYLNSKVASGTYLGGAELWAMAKEADVTVQLYDRAMEDNPNWHNQRELQHDPDAILNQDAVRANPAAIVNLVHTGNHYNLLMQTPQELAAASGRGLGRSGSSVGRKGGAPHRPRSNSVGS